MDEKQPYQELATKIPAETFSIKHVAMAVAFNKTALLLLFAVWTFVSCKKQVADTTHLTSTGTYEVNGIFGAAKFSGRGSTSTVPTSEGTNVRIAASTSDQIIIHNIPSAASGNYNFKVAFSDVHSANPNYLYASLNLDNTQARYTSTNKEILTFLSADGVLTKTGSHSFTFHARMYWLFSSAYFVNVSGSGTY